MYKYGDTFYERLESILELQDIKKITFYTDLSISKTTLMNWKKRSLPSLEVMFSISKYLDVSIDWLLTGNSDQDTTKPDSPAQIVNRIKRRLEELTGLKEYSENPAFYFPLDNCIKPYLLTYWFHGIQIPDISTLQKVSENLQINLQYLITGSNIPPEEYDKYLNSGNTELDIFHKTYNCLTEENRNIVRKICSSLVFTQKKINECRFCIN